MQIAEAPELPVSDEHSGPTESIAVSLAADSYHSPEQRSGLNDPKAGMRAALKGGLLGAVIGMIIPIIGVLLAGMFAVLSYRRAKIRVSGAWLGLKLGAQAGAVSFGIDYLLEMLRIFVTHSQQEVVNNLIKTWQTLGVDTSDPGIQAGIRIGFTPAGLVVALIFVMIAGALLGGLTGAVTAAILGPRRRG
ncbi:MAG TPA: hypothetical protein VMI10_18895 [Terriglobales bacterium]|nr:hypothetical protein [Terriglobales bacterium]